MRKLMVVILFVLLQLYAPLENKKELMFKNYYIGLLTNNSKQKVDSVEEPIKS